MAMLTANDKPVGWRCGFCHAPVVYGGHHDCHGGRCVCSERRDVYEPLITGPLRGQTVTLCAVTIGVPPGAPIRWCAWSRERPDDMMAEDDTPEGALAAFFATCAAGR